MDSLDCLDDFVVLGEAADFLLGKDLAAVDGDDELPSPAFDQFGVDAEFILQRGGQTGRLRKVVSFYAVFDRDVHLGFLTA